MHTDDTIHGVLIAAMLAEAASQFDRAAALIQTAAPLHIGAFSGKSSYFGDSPSRADPARRAAT